ncbi:aspartyl/asparaginyl beta-hydroxylase domain-containing protein [Caballeronia novacaledonica]|uniref:Aspartyl/asparaginyl beta-hydroxylase domain-containing protein n=1 Tax=Caballeronia novacaledonica TaxID=1544861 RepID=A0ACB5QNA1_9BURK|nr:aspartyl/asparaginyl beta-hydroxylase domain-containing protein [Caballeronia novacaledonica]
MFMDPSVFTFTHALERNWRMVRDEFLGVAHYARAWHETSIYSGTWRVCGLFDVHEGTRIEPAATLCARTVALLESCVPARLGAGFSALGPHSHIAAHSGYEGLMLRCHLGLSIPVGNCRLRVGDQEQGWEEGRCLVFDDHCVHEAWNETDEMRVVLIVDFARDSHDRAAR